MSLLSDLAAAYGSAWNQMSPVAGKFKGGTGTTASNLQDALGASQSGYVPTPAAQAQGGSGMSADPQIVPISDAEAQDAQTQQGVPQVDPARIAAAQQQAPAAAPAQAQAQPAAPQGGDMSQVNVQQPNVASVSTNSSFPSPSDYNADGSQAQGGGLLSALAGTAQQAVNDPVQSKGLLSTLGDYAQNLGTKLKSMSPAMSQALIASGLTTLAGNDGRHNLAQLVGEGGIAGVNQYQTVTQNAMANQIARQKLAQDLAEKQATNQVAQTNAQTERFKAMNTPTQVEAGKGVITPQMIASGQGPLPVTGANGQLPVSKYIDVTDGNGNTYQQGVDIWGNKVGQPQPKTLAYTGPVNDAQQKAINDAQTQAATSAQSVNKTQGFLTQLVPKIPDPNNPGQMIDNPNYVPITGGIAATAQNELNKITGGQTQSQMLRQEIQQNIYNAQLHNWKGGVGGRLTNADITLLQKGMPPDNASGTALVQYLQAYSHLQEDQATRDAATAQYVAANRGDMGPLHPNASVTFGGKQYGPGATMQQVLSGQAPVQSQNGNGNAQQAQAIITRAQQAARGGDANAQAALKQRGLSW